VNGVSTVSGTPSATVQTTATQTATTQTSQQASATLTSAGAPSSSGAATASSAADDAAASGNGTAAAAEQSPAESSAAAFQLPGKKLSVLPIGLGVFAGISVIALIVVGLVTYERTKYRKAFRQRKLAESAAGMGYGGMAQR
jgi:hypothetical protein